MTGALLSAGSSVLSFFSSLFDLVRDWLLVKAGMARQRGIDQAEIDKESKEARDVQDHVQSDSDADLDKLRDKWTRH